MQKFLRQAAFVQFLNILVKPAWILIIDRSVQNLLPPADYVSYYTWLSFSILFVILLDLGIHTYNNTKIASNRDFLISGTPALGRLKAFLAILYIAVLFASAWVLKIDKSEVILLSGIAAYQVLQSLGLFFRSSITALGKYKTEGWLSVSERLFSLLACALFLWIPALNEHFNILTFILIQVAGVLFTAIASWLMLWPNWKHREATNNINFSWLKETWPYALLVALMGIYTRSDAVMLRYLSVNGLLETEAYAMSYRLLDAGTMLLAVFSGLLLPELASRLKNATEVARLTSVSASGLLILLIPISWTSFLYSEQIIHLLYPAKNNVQAFDVFFMLMAVLPFIGLIYVYGTLLTAHGSLKFLNFLAVGTVVLNIAGNFILIPELGSLGAAMATLFSQSIFALGCFYKSGKLFSIQIIPGEILKFISWLIIASVSSYGVFLAHFSWILSIVIILAVFYICAWLLNISSLRTRILHSVFPNR